ncbi:adult cuticle protein 1-like [Uranotaenia lowii]|uniref:adult cuticle protein 1-like n=1 Tax=Uranotaenia lowii TaxID=190385 RepID=UPI002479AD84|nr:adult cuticle protein 1-like [Uranotaenia lowii]XP_055601280.1 adult cuticle protein 1-like [Uranotaenia lowii]
MKCIAAVVMMACAVAANAHYVPSVYAQHVAVAPVVTYAAHHAHGPTVVQSNDQHHGWVHHHQAPVVAYSNGHWDHHNVHHHQVPAAVNVVPVAYNNHWAGHHAHAVAVAPVHHQEATYVAANRGAVHKAPLAGHIVNQKSLNLAPAPGTL